MESLYKFTDLEIKFSLNSMCSMPTRRRVLCPCQNIAGSSITDTRS